MRTEWQGYYLDGKTASSRPVTIYLMPTGLQIRKENGQTFCWPYDEIHQTQGFHSGEQVRLEKGGENPETVVIPDAEFLANLHRFAPQRSARFYDPSHRKLHVPLIVLAAVAAIGISAALYLWGIPAAAALIAPHVPVSWEERLGKSIVENMTLTGKQCTDPKNSQAIDHIITKLTSPLTTSPYVFQVVVIDNPEINAFAAPGGYIVVLRGLIRQTKTAEELAGVLAHEIQHILRRHTTRALLQQASTGLLIAALTGDAGHTMNYGLEGARTLGLLRYSRQNEEEADREGMRMLLEARINPKGMIAFFETLKQKGPGLPAGFQYLSTHPSTDDRIEKLKAIAGQSPHAFPKLLPDYDWRDIGNICRS